MKTHYQILIVGGGNGGISVAAQLLIKNYRLDIGIIEPRELHYYQPAWTLVGGGVFNIKNTVRAEAGVIPNRARWIRDEVSSFEPESNSLTCTSGTKYTYDYLIVAPGIQLDWQKIKGLPESLGKNGVSTNYMYEFAPYTWGRPFGISGEEMRFLPIRTPR